MLPYLLAPPDQSIPPRTWASLVRTLADADGCRDSEADTTLRGWYRDECGISPIFCPGHHNPTRPADVVDRLTVFRRERVVVALLFHAACKGDRW